VQFLLTFVKDVEGVVFEIDKKELLHFVGDFVEEAPEVSMSVVVAEHPAQSLVYPEDVVVQVVPIPSIIQI
jgi:hypothetical protein